MRALFARLSIIQVTIAQRFIKVVPIQVQRRLKEQGFVQKHKKKQKQPVAGGKLGDKQAVHVESKWKSIPKKQHQIFITSPRKEITNKDAFGVLSHIKGDSHVNRVDLEEEHEEEDDSSFAEILVGSPSSMIASTSAAPSSIAAQKDVSARKFRVLSNLDGDSDAPE